MAPKMPNNEVKETERQQFGGKNGSRLIISARRRRSSHRATPRCWLRLPAGYTDEWKSVVGCFKRRCRLERHGGPGLPANGTITDLDSDSLETGMSGTRAAFG